MGPHPPDLPKASWPHHHGLHCTGLEHSDVSVRGAAPPRPPGEGVGNAQGSLGSSARATRCREEESSRPGGLRACVCQAGWLGGQQALGLRGSCFPLHLPLVSCPCNLPQVTRASDTLQSPGERTERDSPPSTWPQGPRDSPWFPPSAWQTPQTAYGWQPASWTRPATR